MNYDLKLALLANELKATSEHANEVFAEFVATAMEKAVIDAIDKLSDDDKAILLVLLVMEGEVQLEVEPADELDSRVLNFIKAFEALEMLENAMKTK
jgi:hypothetical protein